MPDKTKNNSGKPLWNLFLVIAEVLLITYLNYKVAGTFYSFDVLYCLPVIQAARLGALHSMRRTDTHIPTVTAVVVAVAWSLVEAAIIWPDFPLSALAMNIFTRSVTFAVISRVVTTLWREREFARKDALTDLGNRVEFFERFGIEQIRSERSGLPYSLLFIDIDKFKMLNDNLGHQVGDTALKTLADILRHNSRRIDTVSRFGGDEFVLLLPETDPQSCEILVNRIDLAAASEFKARNWPISLSIGQITETGNKRSVDVILHDVDTKMYSAKRAK